MLWGSRTGYCSVVASWWQSLQNRRTVPSRRENGAKLNYLGAFFGVWPFYLCAYFLLLRIWRALGPDLDPTFSIRRDPFYYNLPSNLFYIWRCVWNIGTFFRQKILQLTAVLKYCCLCCRKVKWTAFHKIVINGFKKQVCVPARYRSRIWWWKCGTRIQQKCPDPTRFGSGTLHFWIIRYCDTIHQYLVLQRRLPVLQ
jgi:hypothetical protein